MSDPTAPPLPPRTLDFRAAFLSYLLPGLGQVIQGRVAKGLVFFVGIYVLFFYGLVMGQMKNVWLPPGETVSRPMAEVKFSRFSFSGPLKPLAYRPQFLGQFWVGIAAWPAIAQNVFGEKLPDSMATDNRKGLPVIGRYMITPTEDELNMLQRDGDKRWDLGWVYTLIAGVLNLLVIYDAFAGPAIRDDLVPDAPPEPPTGGTA